MDADQTPTPPLSTQGSRSTGSDEPNGLPSGKAKAEGLTRDGIDVMEWSQSDQLRGLAAHVVSSVAHALGSPLNVISGRAEMIRRDPSSALAQLTRIEQQVQKIAAGLRDMVDYLALAEPEDESVPIDDVLSQLAELVRPLAERNGQTLGVELSGELALVPRAALLGTLRPLMTLAIRSAARQGTPTPPLRLHALIQAQWVMIELSVPGLQAEQGWQLEQFHDRPNGAFVDAYQVLSACGAMARGMGGRLQVEPLPAADAQSAGSESTSTAAASGTLIRLSCRRFDEVEPATDARSRAPVTRP